MRRRIAIAKLRPLALPLFAMLGTSVATVPLHAQVLAPAAGRVQQSLVVVGYRDAKGVFAEYGTGFCIKSAGGQSQFLTDYHVAKPDKVPPSTQLMVLTQDSQTAVPAQLEGSGDLTTDLAIVSAPISGMPTLSISAKVPQTTQAIAVGGFPEIEGAQFGGLLGKQLQLQGEAAQLIPAIDMGQVTKVQNRYIHFNIGTSRVDYGDSGAPLFDPQTGEVYGVLEGFVPGATDQGSVATAFVNLATSRDVIADFMAGKSTSDAATAGITRTSAINGITAPFRTAALQGDSAALNILGLMYRDGQSVQRDYKEALHNFGIAAADGDSDAESNIGYMYYSGYGVTKSLPTALHWFELAATEGNAAAQNNAGYMYEHGLGTTRGFSKALQFFRQSAAQRYAAAENNLGFLFEHGLGVPSDYSRAMEWYEKAAAQSYAPAEFNVGSMYDEGHGVNQSYSHARDWYQRAATQGYANAENNLGFLYETGKGVRRNFSVALHWYQLAADQGASRSQYHLGFFYEHGVGAGVDHAAALHWYGLAAAQGDPDALAALNRLRQLLRAEPK